MHTASAHTALRSVLMLIPSNACVTVILMKSFLQGTHFSALGNSGHCGKAPKSPKLLQRSAKYDIIVQAAGEWQKHETNHALLRMCPQFWGFQY